MKLVMKKVLAVSALVSIVVILAPIVMHQSNRQFDGDVHVSLKIPKKPTRPEVAIAEKGILFDSVKVAHVDIPAVPEVQPTMILAKAEPLGPMNRASTTTGKTIIPVLAELQAANNKIIAKQE